MKPETIDKIKAHYEHAVEKHPKFTDKFYSGTHNYAQLSLAQAREDLKWGICDTESIITCELLEIYEAYKGGRLADAKEECYDAIAVLLRMIDMIEKEESNDKY